MAHLQRPLAGFAHDRERLRQQRIELFAVSGALLERYRLGLELGIGQRRDLRLKRIDASDDLPVLLEQPLVAAPENLGEDVDHRVAS